MSKSFSSLRTSAVRLWTRVNQILTDRAAHNVDLWGASLQYRRRYTNPDTAKSFRQVP